MTMHYFRGTFETITKGDGSPVTIADRGIEQTMRVRIAARLPEHGIFGEESSICWSSERVYHRLITWL